MMPHATPRHATPRHILFLLLFLINFTSTARAADIVTGLVGHWKLDGNGNDSSGKGNHGTVVGATGTTDRFAGANRAMSFNGNSQHIRVGNLGSFYSKGTISFWMNSLVVENYRNSFTTRYQGGDTGIRFEENSAGGFGVVVGNDAGTFEASEYLSTGLLSKTWYHVVLVWDTTANLVTGYLNGTQKFSHAHSLWATTISDVAIGNGYNSTRFWKGLLDDVRIYNRALTAADVLALYKDGRPTTIRNAVMRGAVIR